MPVGGTVSDTATLTGGNPASSSSDSESVEVTPQVLTGRAYALAANLYLLGQSAVLIPKTVDTRQVSTTQSTTVAPQCASSPSSKLLCANVTTDAAHARSTATATLLQLALTVPNWPALPAIELKAVQATSTTTCAGAATVVLNEQLPFSTPDRGLTVNAVHVSVGSPASRVRTWCSVRPRATSATAPERTGLTRGGPRSSIRDARRSRHRGREAHDRHSRVAGSASRRSCATAPPHRSQRP